MENIEIRIYITYNVLAYIHANHPTYMHIIFYYLLISLSQALIQTDFPANKQKKNFIFVRNFLSCRACKDLISQ